MAPDDPLNPINWISNVQLQEVLRVGTLTQNLDVHLFYIAVQEFIAANAPFILDTFLEKHQISVIEAESNPHITKELGRFGLEEFAATVRGKDAVMRLLLPVLSKLN